MHQRTAEQLVTRLLRPTFSAQNFRRRDLSWYRRTETTTSILSIEPGQKFRVQLGAVLLRLDKRTHPLASDFHVALAMSALVPSLAEWSELKCYSEWSNDSDPRPSRFTALIVELALPVLDQWRSADDIASFLNTPLARLCQVSANLN